MKNTVTSFKEKAEQNGAIDAIAITDEKGNRVGISKYENGEAVISVDFKNVGYMASLNNEGKQAIIKFLSEEATEVKTKRELYVLVGIPAENAPVLFSNTHFLVYADKNEADRACKMFNDYLVENNKMDMGKFVVDTLENAKLSFPNGKFDYSLLN